MLDATPSVWLSRSSMLLGQSVVVNWDAGLPAGCIAAKSIVGFGFSGSVAATGSRTVTPSLTGFSMWRMHLFQATSGLSMDSPNVGVTVQPVPANPPIAVTRNADGRLELFETNGSDEIWAAEQSDPGSGFAPAVQYGGQLRSVAAARSASGQVQVVGVNGNGDVFTGVQSGPHVYNWPGWTQLFGGLRIASVALARNADGRMEVFATTVDGQAVHRVETSPGGGWTDWADFGATLTHVAAQANADGRVEVFGTNGSGLLHRWQLAGGGWSAWTVLDAATTVAGPLAVARNDDGRMQIFETDSEGRIWRRQQTAPNGAAWTGWALLDGSGWANQVAADTNANGQVELFGVNSQGAQVYHRLQTFLGWSPWAQLGTPRAPTSQATPCNCTAPTAGLTRLANGIRVRTKSVTSIVAAPAGLQVTNPTEISIRFPSQNVRLTKDYNPSAGNTFKFDFSVDDGRARQENIEFDLTERAPSGAVLFHFVVPVTVTPLYDVAISPLTFRLVDNCDLIGDSEPRVGWGDDRGGQQVDLSLSDGQSAQIPQFGRTLTEVGVGAGIQVPLVTWDELDPDTNFHAFPAAGSGPLLPGVTHAVDFDQFEPDRDVCSGHFHYDATITLLTYTDL